MTDHVDYPHEPGRLYDCPACKERCHCAPDVGVATMPCVFFHASDGQGGYRPSEAVRTIVGMIVDQPRVRNGYPDPFQDGLRYGYSLCLRRLVELESGSDDSEWIDETCGELITEAMIARN